MGNHKGSVEGKWRLLAACRREEEASQLLAWIAKSRLKQGKNSPEIARFGNLAKPKGNFSGFSDSLLVNINWQSCPQAQNWIWCARRSSPRRRRNCACPHRGRCC